MVELLLVRVVPPRWKREADVDSNRQVGCLVELAALRVCKRETRRAIPHVDALYAFFTAAAHLYALF